MSFSDRRGFPPSSSFHPQPPFFLVHLFDGVSQGGAVHLVDVLVEKISKEVHADALAHLAEHPSHRLVHQVVGMVEVFLGIMQAP